MGRGVNPDGWEALVELRDQLAKGEKVGWYVVYNGDEERWAPKEEEEEEDAEEDVEEEEKEVVAVSLSLEVGCPMCGLGGGLMLVV